MALLAFVAAPALIAQSSIKAGLVFWMLMVAGMIWQFVVSVVVLRVELGTLRWSVVRDRIWLNRPRDPRTGEPRRILWLWVLPAIAANVAGGLLAAGLDDAWKGMLVGILPEPEYTAIQGLADPSLEGQWWIFALALVSCLFNYLLGEELLFRGVLLPRMAGVFGRWDWVANTVLFGLYHVHKIWAIPGIILSSFGFAWATRRYRSLWMGVITHGVEAYFLVLVLGVILGVIP
jgi:membrane protease YdiL (CAAX protease family)